MQNNTIVDRPGFTEEERAFAREGQVLWGGRPLQNLPYAGLGKGKRAVHFQYAMQLDPTIFTGSQAYSNCAAWAGREIIGYLMAIEKVEKNQPLTYEHRPGTAVIYGSRRQSSDSGMTLPDVARVLTQVGIGFEKNYTEIGLDLSSQSKDEAAGVKWGRSGPPAELLALIKNDLIQDSAEVQDPDQVIDLLYAGAAIITGSTTTARGTGDPVSSAGPVGGHAQALIGYDDTDEFRQYYKEKTGKSLTEWVGIFDQSWGPGWLSVNNWPDHLWGPRPEGAFVLKRSDAMRLVTQWGQAIAFSGVKGFPIRKLPDWGTSSYL